jgi:hypothetical protein
VDDGIDVPNAACADFAGKFIPVDLFTLLERNEVFPLFGCGEVVNDEDVGDSKLVQLPYHCASDEACSACDYVHQGDASDE